MNEHQRCALVRESIEMGVSLHWIESFLDRYQNLLREKTLEKEEGPHVFCQPSRPPSSAVQSASVDCGKVHLPAQRKKASKPVMGEEGGR